MGLFSKRRAKGFDPEMWSDATDRSKAGDEKPWFADLDVSGDDPSLDELETNAGARFADRDEEWLGDDPGEEVRKRDH